MFYSMGCSAAQLTWFSMCDKRWVSGGWAPAWGTVSCAESGSVLLVVASMVGLAGRICLPDVACCDLRFQFLRASRVLCHGTQILAAMLAKSLDQCPQKTTQTIFRKSLRCTYVHVHAVNYCIGEAVSTSSHIDLIKVKESKSQNWHHFLLCCLGSAGMRHPIGIFPPNFQLPNKKEQICQKNAKKHVLH